MSEKKSEEFLESDQVFLLCLFVCQISDRFILSPTNLELRYTIPNVMNIIKPYLFLEKKVVLLSYCLISVFEDLLQTKNKGLFLLYSRLLSMST